MILIRVLHSNNPIRSLQSALGRLDRARALHDLVTPLINLYAAVDVEGNFNSPIGDLEDIIIRIAVQTIECGIFIWQYLLNTGERPDILSGDICTCCT